MAQHGGRARTYELADDTDAIEFTFSPVGPTPKCGRPTAGRSTIGSAVTLWD